MSCEKIQIKNLENKQPYFKEFCEIKGLKNGDYFKSIEFIIFADSLSISERTKIIQKWHNNNAE